MRRGGNGKGFRRKCPDFKHIINIFNVHIDIDESILNNLNIESIVANRQGVEDEVRSKWQAPS